MAAPHSGVRKQRFVTALNVPECGAGMSQAGSCEHTTLGVTTHNILCKTLERLWRLGRKPLFDFRVVTEPLDENLVSSWTTGKLQIFLIYSHCVKPLKKIMGHPDTFN